MQHEGLLLLFNFKVNTEFHSIPKKINIVTQFYYLYTGYCVVVQECRERAVKISDENVTPFGKCVSLFAKHDMEGFGLITSHNKKLLKQHFCSTFSCFNVFNCLGINILM